MYSNHQQWKYNQESNRKLDRLGKIVIFILWNFGQETLVFWPVEIGACCKCHPILGWDYHLMPSTSVPASRSGIPLPGWSATGLFIHGPSVPMAKWLTFPSRKLLSWALNPSKPCLLVGPSKNSSGEGICYIIINLYIYNWKTWKPSLKTGLPALCHIAHITIRQEAKTISRHSQPERSQRTLPKWFAEQLGRGGVRAQTFPSVPICSHPNNIGNLE